MKKIGDVLPFVLKRKKGVQTLSNRHRQIIELAGTLAEQTREERGHSKPGGIVVLANRTSFFS